MALLGQTPAAVRLVSALPMLALCLGLFQFCRLHGSPRAGCFASVGLSSALPVAVTLPFYLGQVVPVIDSTSRDLQFGCDAVPGTACVSGAGFLRQRARGPVAVAVAASHADQFRALAGARGWRVEWAGGKMVFFSTPQGGRPGTVGFPVHAFKRRVRPGEAFHDAAGG